MKSYLSLSLSLTQGGLRWIYKAVLSSDHSKRKGSLLALTHLIQQINLLHGTFNSVARTFSSRYIARCAKIENKAFVRLLVFPQRDFGIL